MFSRLRCGSHGFDRDRSWVTSLSPRALGHQCQAAFRGRQVPTFLAADSCFSAHSPPWLPAHAALSWALEPLVFLFSSQTKILGLEQLCQFKYHRPSNGLK